MGLETRFVTGKVMIDSAHRVFIVNKPDGAKKTNSIFVQSEGFIGDFVGKEVDITIKVKEKLGYGQENEAGEKEEASSDEKTED